MRNRTMNVDIDSKGRSCKERMLTVLFDGPINLDKRYVGTFKKNPSGMYKKGGQCGLRILVSMSIVYLFLG